MTSAPSRAFAQGLLFTVLWTMLQERWGGGPGAGGRRRERGADEEAEPAGSDTSSAQGISALEEGAAAGHAPSGDGDEMQSRRDTIKVD